MTIITIAGYRFIPLTHLQELRQTFLQKCQTLMLQGTILLSQEGININIAGLTNNILLFKTFLAENPCFAEITFHEGGSSFNPFNFLKVKVKPEIITMRTTSIHPETQRAPSLSPQELKQWLDEGRDITLLDTRNDYEVRFGTFKNAINPVIDNFAEFPKLAKTFDPNKPVVMFCTGGIRCEKAALHLLQEGFQQVFQLQNGILNYFKQVGNAHYQGECFVFDQRVAVDENLTATGTKQCRSCQGPIRKNAHHDCER